MKRPHLISQTVCVMPQAVSFRFVSFFFHGFFSWVLVAWLRGFGRSQPESCWSWFRQLCFVFLVGLLCSMDCLVVRLLQLDAPLSPCFSGNHAGLSPPSYDDGGIVVQFEIGEVLLLIGTDIQESCIL